MPLALTVTATSLLSWTMTSGNGSVISWQQIASNVWQQTSAPTCATKMNGSKYYMDPTWRFPACHGGTPWYTGCFLLGKIPSFEMDDDWGCP